MKDLKKEIPFQWKIQSFNKDKTKASCVAYIDARDVMDILDQEVWAENWKDTYEMVWNRFMCTLWIKVWEEWVGKTDTGNEADIEWDKSQVSDAFKRAAVKWGVGRFLYNKEIVWVNIDQYKNPINKDGSKISDLNEYCNKLSAYFSSLKK